MAYYAHGSGPAIAGDRRRLLGRFLRFFRVGFRGAVPLPFVATSSGGIGSSGGTSTTGSGSSAGGGGASSGSGSGTAGRSAAAATATADSGKT